tara:strand:- start:666 stop:1775 length:1110 start_codon:yes stop_codon:yes gene_type:complete
MNLNKNLFTKKEEHIPTRNGFGEALVKAGKRDERVVALCADLTESTRIHHFKNAFPDRFIEVGVAEQNLVGVAAGMAHYGKIPFCASYATFSPGRSWDQCRVSVAYGENNVKIVGAHAGISVGPDGATHQALEDISLMRVLPNMTVIAPCDSHQAHAATLAAAKMNGPVYLRFTREKTPVMTTPKTPFKIGKAQVMREGTDLTIVATGPILYEALMTAEILAGNKKALAKLLERYPDIAQNVKKSKLHGHSMERAKETTQWTPVKIKKKIDEIGKLNIEVINVHTIKPLDHVTLKRSAKKTGLVMTVEEHQIHGGLRAAVAESLSLNYPTKIIPIGMPDSFGESGKPMELLEKYGMTAPWILQNILKTI